MSEVYDLLVIGGGPAGVTAALRGRELGARVALVEQDRMGGTCTNDGCVPTRVLAKAARLVREADQFASYGLRGQQPAVDFPALLGKARSVVDQIHAKKDLLNHLEQAGVDLFTGSAAQFIDPHTVGLADGRQLRAEKCIICAGGRARRLPFPGSEYSLTSSDVWTMEALPRRVIVIGAAATGCQLASVLAAFGAEVTLLETLPRVLANEDEAISSTITDLFNERGITIVTGIEGVERIEKRDSDLELWYNTKAGAQSLAVDGVIAAVGWPGNADRLNLEAAGVKTERNAIVVDDYLRSSVPHIFAAGDITGRVPLVQTGSADARIAAENALLGTERANQHRVVPHGGFTDPEYGSVGLTEERAREQGACIVATIPYTDIDRAVIDGLDEGICKLIVSRESRHIVGAHIVGEQAVEIAQLVAASMAAETPIELLAELELAYPTYTAIVGLAARQIARELGVTTVAPHWRTLIPQRPAEWERSSL